MKSGSITHCLVCEVVNIKRPMPSENKGPIWCKKAPLHPGIDTQLAHTESYCSNSCVWATSQELWLFWRGMGPYLCIYIKHWHHWPLVKIWICTYNRIRVGRMKEAQADLADNKLATHDDRIKHALGKMFSKPFFAQKASLFFLTNLYNEISIWWFFESEK